MSEVNYNNRYIFVTIPFDYAELYHKIMALLADYGEAKLQDCTPQCIEKSSVALNCYNMFIAAIAARNNQRFPLEHALIAYVKATIDNFYKNGYIPPNFIYEQFESGNVLIDIDENKLVTNDGIWSIIPYSEQPVLITTYYSEPSGTPTINNGLVIPRTGGNYIINLSNIKQHWRKTFTIGDDEEGDDNYNGDSSWNVEYDLQTSVDNCYIQNGTLVVPVNTYLTTRDLGTVNIKITRNNEPSTWGIKLTQAQGVQTTYPLVYGQIPLPSRDVALSLAEGGVVFKQYINESIIDNNNPIKKTSIPTGYTTYTSNITPSTYSIIYWLTSPSTKEVVCNVLDADGSYKNQAMVPTAWYEENNYSYKTLQNYKLSMILVRTNQSTEYKFKIV